MDKPEAAIQTRVLKLREKREAKAAEAAERMKPRPCRFCKAEFVPKRVQDWKSEFCCREHQATFWIKANQLSASLLRGGAQPEAPVVQSEYRPGVSHRQQVLGILERNVNQWVEHPRKLLPNVVWNSRIADLRREGHVIETRRFGDQPNDVIVGPEGQRLRRFGTGGNLEYQYRLVREAIEAEDA